MSFRAPRQPFVDPGEIEHHVADLTVTASGDVTLEVLQARLAEHDQWLPIDGDPSQPLGQLVETNSTGPLRLGFGAWRDLLLGVQFTTSSGQLITAGGRAMKNVAGYDLTKLMVGQRGVFGKIATITARTYKRPASALLVQFRLSDKFINHLLPTTSRPQWAMLAEGFLWCGYLGDEATIGFCQTDVRSHGPMNLRRQSLQDDIDVRARHWQSRDFRASVPPARILEFVQGAALKNWAADAAFGIVVGPCAVDQKDALNRAADAVSGAVWFTDDADFQTTDPQRDLPERLKSAFNA